MNTLHAFKGDTELKRMMLEEVEKHRKADQIIQKTYGEEVDGKWRGCAVGCSIHSLNEKLGTHYDTSEHNVYETALGIPEWFARLEDAIFEGLPVADAKKWPGEFLKAIPVGANLEPVKWHFCAFLMKRNIDRVLALDIPDDLKKRVVDAIRGVLAVHENAITTGEWNAAAAESAAESAAWSAWSAAWSAESAESAEYKLYSRELLRLLKKAA